LDLNFSVSVLIIKQFDSITISAPSTQVNLVIAKPNQGSGEKEPNMLIIGLDYHPSFQQIAFVDDFVDPSVFDHSPEWG